jgi:hypothetical protein
LDNELSDKEVHLPYRFRLVKRVVSFSSFLESVVLSTGISAFPLT